MATQRPSSTSVTTDAPIAIYSNSKEATDLGPNYIRIIPGNSVGAIYASSQNTAYDEVNAAIEAQINEIDAAAETEDDPVEILVKVAPDLSDIQLVSNVISYDASGNPTSTIIFKVKNSSGAMLKGMNARVKVI